MHSIRRQNFCGLLAPLLLAALAGCEAIQAAADALSENAASDGTEEPAATGEPTEASAKKVEPAIPPIATTVPPLLKGDPPFAFTYVPFKAQVTTTSEANVEATPETPEVASSVTLKEGQPGLFTIQIEKVEGVLDGQQNKAWCWAACAVAVNEQELSLGYATLAADIPTQAQLAAYFRGDDEQQGAPVATMMRAINLDLEVGLLAENGVTVQVTGNLMTTDALVDALLQGRLAILGLEDEYGKHALVVVGATFGVVPGGTLGEDAGMLGRATKQAASRLETIGVDTGDTKEVAGRTERAGEIAAELLSRYAIERVAYFDPLEPSKLKFMGADQLKEQCRVIMTAELGRKILTGEGLTAQGVLTDAAEDTLDG